MPRPTVPAVTAAQARYILEKLLDEGSVTAADVRRHLAGMWEEMSIMERRLAALRDLPAVMKHPIRRAKARLRQRKLRTVSPEVADSRALQGQYIGLLRQVPKGNRKRFADIARTRGREAAVAALKKRLGK